MSVWEFNHRVKGVSDRAVEKWRQLRWLGAIVLSPHSKKALRPMDLFELPGDDQVQKPTMTPEQKQKDIQWKLKLYKIHGNRRAVS